MIEQALNRIWGATSRTFLHGRALTIGMVGLVGLLLASSVLVTSVMVALREMAGSRFSPRQIERYTLLASVGSAFWQVLFAAAKLFGYGGSLRPRLSLHAEGEVTLRDTLPGVSRGTVVGNREVHLRVSLLLSLRSGLRIRRRCGRGPDVELRFEFDPALRRTTHGRLPLRASFQRGKRRLMHIADFDYELPAQ